MSHSSHSKDRNTQPLPRLPSPASLNPLQLQVAATLIQAALLLYLYLWHRTSIALHHPWEARMIGNVKALQHPLARRLDPPRNPICPFGKAAAKVGAVLLVARALVWSYTGRKWLSPNTWIALYVAGLAVALGMNFNAFLYLLPSFLVEYFLVYRAQEAA